MEHDPDLGEPAPLPEEPKYFAIHPLFPLPEGVRETKEIHQIAFDRWDHKGVKERSPDRFLASELHDFGQVIDMFGGGTYQFIAFDSKGNFSRWTPHNERLHSSLPCKPLRSTVHQPSQPQEEPAPARPAQTPDISALMMQQLIASQERSDRLLQAMIERLANPPPPPPSPYPPIDPMAMITGVATIFEKLRPMQSSDPISQLSGLASIAQKLNGRQAASSDADDAALQPLVAMMTQAMNQNANPPQPQPTHPQRPAIPPGMIWVDMPRVGPVLMRPEQAANVFAPPPPARVPEAPPPAPPVMTPHVPAAPPPAPPAPAAPVRESWESIAARLTAPKEQAAFKEAIEQRMQAMSLAQSAPRATEAPARSLITAAPAPAPQAPEAQRPPSNAAPPPQAPQPPQAMPTVTTAAQPKAPKAEAPKPEARPVPRCIVCKETGYRDPAQPHVLICRNSHRSLIPGEPIEQEPMVPLSLDSLPISLEQLDAILADEAAQKEIPPQVLAALREIRAGKMTA